MRDQKKWAIAISRFNGYCTNIPNWPKAEEVEDYHAHVKALEEASGEDLAHFMIPSEKIKPKVVGGRRRGYGGSPGYTQYSDVDYCDSDFFESQIAGLKLYVTELQRKPQAANKYEALDYNELQDLMITRNPNPGMVLINGRPDHELSREEMIEHLLKQDRFRAPLHSTTNYNYNLHHSNMIADSPGASIISNVGLSKGELQNFVDEIRGLLKTLDIDAKTKQGINLNIGTIELHLTDDEPNPSIIRESLKSLRTIGENAAGSLLGTALLPPVLHLLSKLP